MFLEIAAGSYLLADYVYHRFHDSPQSVKNAAPELQVPITDEGEAVPILYGRTKIRRSVLAWIDQPHVYAGSGTFTGFTFYSMSMLYVLGIGMDDGHGTNRIHAVWAGDLKLTESTAVGYGPLSALDGGGAFEDAARNKTSLISEVTANSDVMISGAVEFLNGNVSQILADGSGAYTRAGVQMTINNGTTEQFLQGNVDPTLLPGFRGYLSAFLYGIASAHANVHFNYGVTPQMPAFSFEASSYRDGGGYPAVGVYAQPGQDGNPINALYDLLTRKRGKLGLLESQIDMPSFQAAATKLFGESHGYSRCIDSRQEVSAVIAEILEQIDGVMYEDPTTATLKLKLIRPDFDPTTILGINRNNCDSLTGFAMSGQTGAINRVRVVYTNRAKDYEDDSEVAENLAGVSGQDNVVREIVLRYPGCHEKALAANLAARELAARSRPLIKCSAHVSADFLRVMPGDAVSLTWTKPDLSGLVFRVAAVDHGNLSSGLIRLDLVQDYQYTWRNLTPKPPHYGSDDVTITMG